MWGVGKEDCNQKREKVTRVEGKWEAWRELSIRKSGMGETGNWREVVKDNYMVRGEGGELEYGANVISIY